MSDDELVRGFVVGEPRCHRQVDAWIGEVLGSRYLQLGVERDDVAQEVRRRLLVSFRLGHFSGQARLRTYVWRAAQNAALNGLRARRRHGRVTSIDNVDEPASTQLGPERQMERDERSAILKRVWAAMGDDCRRLWQMIVFEELPYRDIASRLGVSEGSVKVRALRCRRAAARLCQELLGGGAAPGLTPETR